LSAPVNKLIQTDTALNQIIVSLVILFLIVSLYKNQLGLGFAFIIGINVLRIFSLLLGLFLATNLLACFITNIGAVAITIPIAISLAAQLGVDPKPFALLIAFAGVASFMTPIGYQTNLIVYNPEGYNFKDSF
jgi:di/tricarboxylate transporter